MTAAAKAKLDAEVCESALKFVNLYNEIADHRRKQIDVLYATTNPCMIYNGNVIQGIAEINVFWEALQDTSHELSCLDAHPLSADANNSNNKTIIAQVMGNVTLDGQCRAYNQVLLLVDENGLYKIQNENYRITE